MWITQFLILVDRKRISSGRLTRTLQKVRLSSTYHYGLGYEISPNRLPGNTTKLVWEEGKVMTCFSRCQKGG